MDDLGNKKYIVNRGPKVMRDQLNSISSFLACLDSEYRNNLYKYHLDCISKGVLPYQYKVPRSKFSFRNIHMNLGKVRWYSTKITTKRSKLTTTELLTSRADKSMEKDSLVFNQLSNYLKDSPINEDTQLKIERFLLDFSYITYENKKDSNTPIDYSLISNNLTKYLKSNETILNSYIDNIRRKTFFLN